VFACESRGVSDVFVLVLLPPTTLGGNEITKCVRESVREKMISSLFAGYHFPDGQMATSRVSEDDGMGYERRCSLGRHGLAE
jgi:hypothetical protein